MTKMSKIENELLEKMCDLFNEIMKNQEYLKTIKSMKGEEGKNGLYVASRFNLECKDDCDECGLNGDIYYMKIAHMTQKEYDLEMAKEHD